MFVTDSASNGFTSNGLGSADSEKLLKRNKLYEIKLTGLNSTATNDDKLTNSLRVSSAFSLKIVPPREAALSIERAPPYTWMYRFPLEKFRIVHLHMVGTFISLGPASFV